ncbi:hypothetical protein QGN32_08825 [Mycolicibacterium sp. ND9-15]|uniref:hypothetical protein n=1 Tax=Mycolicibacterium sp. ND9-15 TaxID=3042320 RepID=UPI002DD96497|nr:hypothetical protein [Mycolicibacterium sp. ND9-15]WSE57930.1 hypothetical protein QGN32_08825 [Mycolicibacterium sp. ND9-15]
MTAPAPRTRVVTAAFWCWIVASVMLLAGGLIAASWEGAPAVFRGAGVISAIAGAGVALLAGRSRGGDPRYRRALIALSLTIVGLISISAVVGIGNVITLLAVFPLLAGAVLVTRRGAVTRGEAT